MKLALLLLLLFTSTLLYASPAEEPEEPNVPILETAHRIFGSQVNIVANRFDVYFADQRADDELARSRLRIIEHVELRERQILEKDTTIRFNLRLPNLEDRLKFEAKQEAKKSKKPVEEFDPKKREKYDRTTLRLIKQWQFRADLGANASIPPNIFARTRFRKNFEAGEVINRFVEEFSWFSDRDFEQHTTLDSDYSPSKRLLYRFRNSTDWKVTRKDFTTDHGPVIFQHITDNDAIRYIGAVSTRIEDGVFWMTNVRLAVDYRRNLYKQWVYFDIIPGLDFPKKWHFRRTPFIGFQIEALFGGY